MHPGRQRFAAGLDLVVTQSLHSSNEHEGHLIFHAAF